MWAVDKDPEDWGARTRQREWDFGWPREATTTVQAPCERNLAAVVCAVTAALAASVATLSLLAGHHGHGAALRAGTLWSDSEGAVLTIDTVSYSGCTDCPEELFCQKAGNPGCGDSGGAEVVTFYNLHNATGCSVKPVLTIPRSYITDINDLRHQGGARQMLTIMLEQGFNEYRDRGHEGPVQQCIHHANVVTVHWLHLHSFCVGATFDGMPGGGAMCKVMEDVGEADGIAGEWLL